MGLEEGVDTERGLYAAASGMIVQMIRTDTIANNLANVDTTGFKKDDSVFQSFLPFNIHRVEDELIPTPKGSMDPRPYVGPLGMGAEFLRNFIDFSQGSLRRTDNPLDLAISGPDFFVIQTPAGRAFTRDGSFFRNADGVLVTQAGYPVLGIGNQRMVLGDGKIRVGQDGSIFVNGELTGQLQRVTFQQPRTVQKIGRNLYRSTGRLGGPQGEVHQGFLEASNANAIQEIIRLIEAQRAYQASARALQSEDSSLQLAVTDVGRSTGR